MHADAYLSHSQLYTVTVEELPSCSCPDWSKGNICKHLVSVYDCVSPRPNANATRLHVALCVLESAWHFAPGSLSLSKGACPVRITCHLRERKTESYSSCFSHAGKRVPRSHGQGGLASIWNGGVCLDFRRESASKEAQNPRRRRSLFGEHSDVKYVENLDVC
jgi:hypothetical protein